MNNNPPHGKEPVTRHDLNLLESSSLLVSWFSVRVWLGEGGRDGEGEEGREGEDTYKF